MEFTVFHEYSRLSRAGLVGPLRCPRENWDLVVKSRDGEPVLQCYMCGSIYDPGIDLYDRMKAAIAEALGE